MENTYINTFSKIVPLQKVNKEFALVKVYVHGIGKNRNFSYISKEVAMDALPSLNYVPVVGHIRHIKDEEGNVIESYMGSHDTDIDWEKWEIIDLTVPYGTVIENSFGWETIEEYGESVEYLTAYAYLWVGRYPELLETIFDEDDVWFNQSMEIKILDNATRPLDEDSNYTEIMKMQYSALCLLGKSEDPEKHSEPCFINSKVVVEDYSLDNAMFSQLMDEMKESLARYDLNDVAQKGNEEMDKTPIEEIQEEEVQEADVVKDVEPLGEVAENDFSVTREEYEALMEELLELRAFKEERLAEEKKAAYEAVIADFEDLKDNDEFVKICENLLNFESEDILREKCFAIRGKLITYAEAGNFNFNKKEGKIGITINTQSVTDTKYGDFFNKF